MTTTARIIAAAVFLSIAATIGLNIGPRPADVEAFAHSEAYKAQEAAHFAKLARQEAAR